MPDENNLSKLAKKRLFGSSVKGSVKPGAFLGKLEKLPKEKVSGGGYDKFPKPGKEGVIGGKGVRDVNAFGETGKMRNQTANFNGPDTKAMSPKSPPLIPKGTRPNVKPLVEKVNKSIKPSQTAGKGLNEKVYPRKIILQDNTEPKIPLIPKKKKED